MYLWTKIIFFVKLYLKQQDKKHQYWTVILLFYENFTNRRVQQVT